MFIYSAFCFQFPVSMNALLCKSTVQWSVSFLHPLGPESGSSLSKSYPFMTGIIISISNDIKFSVTAFSEYVNSLPVHSMLVTMPQCLSILKVTPVALHIQLIIPCQKNMEPLDRCFRFSSASVLSLPICVNPNGIRIKNGVPIPFFTFKGNGSTHFPPVFVIGIPSPVPANFVRFACSCANGSKCVSGMPLALLPVFAA